MDAVELINWTEILMYFCFDLITCRCFLNIPSTHRFVEYINGKGMGQVINMNGKIKAIKRTNWAIISITSFYFETFKNAAKIDKVPYQVRAGAGV